MTLTTIIVQELQRHPLGGHYFRANHPEHPGVLGVGNTPVEVIGDLMLNLAKAGHLIVEFRSYDHSKVSPKPADNEV